MSRDTRPTRHEIAYVSEGFLACTLPADEFHHREHLIVTTYLRVTDPTRDLRADLPDLIRRYNVASGGVNDDSHGYHHTITMGYLDLIDQVLAGLPSNDMEDACAAVLGSPAAERDVLLHYWSRDTLFSTEARLGWVEPDVRAVTLDVT
jgi:hypothetical protein